MSVPSTSTARPSSPAPSTGRIAAPDERRRDRGLRLWLRAVRVRQWPKNLLVVAAPVAANMLLREGTFSRVVLAFVVFCLLASGVYLLNDVHDAPEDRQHPAKRHRAIASGAITARQAIVVGVLLALAGLGLSLVAGWALFACAAGYLALNAAYTGWLRQVAIADLAVIAGVFLLRAAAGGLAAGIAISRWFIVVVSFSALLVAAGRRLADLVDVAARRSRPVLEEYTPEFLRMVIAVGCAVAVGGYCLWAFEARHPHSPPWRELTVVPFTMALLRYGLLVTRGGGSAPEDILLRDRFMAVVGAAWLLLFVFSL
jgi:decaprenyl-phosphate phosphoribosyltransferase